MKPTKTHTDTHSLHLHLHLHLGHLAAHLSEEVSQYIAIGTAKIIEPTYSPSTAAIDAPQMTK